MSETTTNTSDACELVLDYVYGELDEARKRTFEEHLPTCARCQQEVVSFGRVRTAVKRVMPAVEPSASLGGGALHAQLMHAAAQRKPKRGMLLAFPRKIVEHPALSAAAMFVLVGGAIAINWSHGKMAMPAAEHATVDAPKPTEVEPEATTDKLGKAANGPAAEPMVAAKDKEAEQADDNSVSLATGKGNYTVERPAAHRAVATAAPKKAALRTKTIASDGKAAKYDNAFGDTLGAKDEAGNDVNGLEGGAPGGVAGGAIGGGGRGAASEAAKSSAPSDLTRKSVAEKAPAREDKQEVAHGYKASPPPTVTMPQAPPPPAPAPTAAASTPASTSNERDYGAYRSQQQAVAKPAGSARNYDVLRKQADDWAKTNRCDEAIKAYEELDKSSQRLLPNERVQWVRCLAQRGRQEEAQQRLDDLKQDKRVTNALIQNAEKELSDSRARRVENKKAKKAPAADRAPAQSETRQQSQQRPAEAAPPDSTNTKVQKPAF
jgi:hypothetical protein